MKPDLHRTGSILRAVVLITALVFTGCEEELPLRNDPAVLLESSLEVRPGYTTIRDSVGIGQGGAFLLTLKNVYDEVLSDSAQIQANLEVRMLSRPELYAVVRADGSNLLNSNVFRSNIVTLGVDTAAILLKQWSHKASNGVPFWTYVTLRLQYTPAGTPYLQSDTVRFSVRGSIQVFKYKAPTPFRETQIGLVYQVFDVTPTAPH
jgi:hypothetical protein